jgi:hypothetical protein
MAGDFTNRQQRTPVGERQIMEVIVNHLYRYHKQITITLLVVAIITWSVALLVFGVRVDALHAIQNICK